MAWQPSTICAFYFEPLAPERFWKAVAANVREKRAGNSHDVHGYIAQWLERLTADQQVPGSNPGVPFSITRVFARSALNLCGRVFEPHGECLS